MEYEMLTLAEAEDRYTDYIDDNYKDIEVMGITIPASEVLRQCDPTAFRVYFHDFADAMYQNGEAIENYNDSDIIECEECGIYTDDFRGDYCKDCDKQEQVEV